MLEAKRRVPNRLGFALQLVTMCNAETFLDDPLGCRRSWSTTSPSCSVPGCLGVKAYGERPMTRLEGQGEIRSTDSWREFSCVEGELGGWVETRAWTPRSASCRLRGPRRRTAVAGSRPPVQRSTATAVAVAPAKMASCQAIPAAPVIGAPLPASAVVRFDPYRDA